MSNQTKFFNNNTNVEINFIQLLPHCYMPNLKGIFISSLLNIIFATIGLIFSLTINRKKLKFDEDPFKHHSTKWQLGLVIFTLTIFNDIVGLVLVVFFWHNLYFKFSTVSFYNQFLKFFY